MRHRLFSLLPPLALLASCGQPAASPLSPETERLLAAAGQSLSEMFDRDRGCR